MNKIEFIVESDLWEKNEDLGALNANISKIFDVVIKEKKLELRDFSVNMLLTDNAKMKELNFQYRAINSETNVLSFPQFNREFFENFKENNVFLGDIAMSYERILDEAREFGIGFRERYTHLFVHGILHLFGMAHGNEQEMLEMETEEVRILGSVGIKNPYII